jgi:hypothetical protein
VFGALIGAISHYAQHGRRDFASLAQTRADRYEVQVDQGFATQADQLLGRFA